MADLVGGVCQHGRRKITESRYPLAVSARLRLQRNFNVFQPLGIVYFSDDKEVDMHSTCTSPDMQRRRRPHDRDVF